MRQLPLDIGLATPHSFDTFVGDGNAAVLELLRRAPAFSAPVYLWGPAGAGKSHLLQAAAEQCRLLGFGVAAFDPGRPAPWRLGAAPALILLDGCEHYDAAQQHAAFTLFVDAAALGTPVLAAGRLPPVDLPLREDLRTRLGWGWVHAVEPLGEAASRGALRREADRRGLFLPDEVLDYLLHRCARDLGHLVAQLDALDAYALVHKRALTVPLLRQMLSETPSSP